MIELGDLVVGGISIGGVETCIDLPRQRLAFDLGRCPDAAVARPTVLFTHAHMDHMGAVAWHAATRALRGMAPPTYVVPHENASALGDLFAAWRELDRSDLEHTLVPLGPGEELALPNRMVARPFRSPHRAPCQGYGLWRRHQRLLPSLRGLSTEDVAERARSGEPVSEVVESPEFAFTGDTRVEVLEREEVVRRARVLALECTFVDDRVPVEQARAMGHVHLDELAERAELFENEHVLLTHFSARYTRDEVERALDVKLPPELRRRVTVFWCGR